MRVQRGVTLIELVTVLVVLSILAVVGTGFIVSTTNAYQQTQERARLTNTGRLALERMNRELRNAQPYSLETDTLGCVRFLPILAGGVYTGTVPDQSNGRPAEGTIDIIPIDYSGDAAYVAIGALSSAEVYLTGESLTGFQALSGSALSVDPIQWARNSVSRRFYLLDRLHAFCMIDDELRFYRDLPGLTENISLSDSYVLLAKDAREPDDRPTFLLQAATESENAIISIEFLLSDGSHQISFDHEVHTRNVP
ncbi:PilW family protein [Marinimicrobium alkaliphilum]|uniref:PilW family protein n=1 Tax=Marinimicrobium alkaliphilum TaxID=2202654 RepID=UPI000DBA8C00|nr:prepilin-type N-terminal cleavage/methylation domain-containing protein [Marinimicrobium alkaliphilum]